MAARKKGAVRMGRPPGPPESVRRNRVGTLVTDGELVELQRLADARGVPIAAIIYEAVKRTLARRR